ncbi:MAG: hypothetical protein DYH01_04555 [Chlorobi bacterium CHB7]|nr:hypothetical protein [Chlorobi bacterium CHB7]
MLITIASEYIVLMLFCRKRFVVFLWYIVLINLFTHPIANIFYNSLSNELTSNINGIELLPFFVVEIFVVLVEWILIKILFEFSYSKSFIISLSCNTFSASFSFLI